MKSAEKIINMLDAFDLTGSLRDAGELVGVSHHTVARYVAVREGGLAVRRATRPMLIDEFLPKVEEWVDRSSGKVRADVAHDTFVALGFTGSERTTRRSWACRSGSSAPQNHRCDSRAWFVERPDRIDEYEDPDPDPDSVRLHQTRSTRSTGHAALGGYCPPLPRRQPRNVPRIGQGSLKWLIFRWARIASYVGSRRASRRSGRLLSIFAMRSTNPSILSKNFLSTGSRLVYSSWTIRWSTSGMVRTIGASIENSSTTISSRTADGSPFAASSRASMKGSTEC